MRIQLFIKDIVSSFEMNLLAVYNVKLDGCELIMLDLTSLHEVFTIEQHPSDNVQTYVFEIGTYSAARSLV